LPRVRQILEVTQKNNRLAKRREPRRRFHRILRIANQRIATDSALQAFVTNFFTRLPCGVRQHLLTSFPA
jgi:hypothetical protein